MAKKEKENLKKEESKNVKKVSKKPEKKEKKEKKSIWARFMTFCNGVKDEFKRVHWPSKKDMIKYSIATIVFIIFCSLFFYLIRIIFAFVHSILN